MEKYEINFDDLFVYIQLTSNVKWWSNTNQFIQYVKIINLFESFKLSLTGVSLC